MYDVDSVAMSARLRADVYPQPPQPDCWIVNQLMHALFDAAKHACEVPAVWRILLCVRVRTRGLIGARRSTLPA